MKDFQFVTGMGAGLGVKYGVVDVEQKTIGR